MTDSQLKKVIDLHDKYTCYALEWMNYDEMSDQDYSYFAALGKRRDALYNLYASHKSDKKALRSRQRECFAVTISIDTLLNLICGEIPDSDENTEE